MPPKQKIQVIQETAIENVENDDKEIELVESDP